MPENEQVIHDPEQWEDERTPMHAHRCMACSKNGIDTVWIHGDNRAGDVAAHKCPKCGEIQWKKWMVEIGQLPRVQAQAKRNYEALLGYLVLAVSVALLGYLAFIYVRAWRSEKKTV